MTAPANANEVERPDPVKRNSLIFNVLRSRPLAGKVLREAFNLPCEECVVSEKETIEEGARYYGHDADAIVKRLNECPLAPEPEKKKPATPPASGPAA